MAATLCMLVLAFVAVVVPAEAASWVDNPGSAGFPQSRAICKAMPPFEPPSGDEPTEGYLARHLSGCSSESLYFGIGVVRDPGRAKQCAYSEQPPETGDISGLYGPQILMMVYANGLGAKRNLDVALSLACSMDDIDAPAETDGRVLHLDKLRKDHWTGTDFSWCDDITSGYNGGICASVASDIKAATRKATLAALQKSWNRQDRAAYLKLEKAEKAYSSARAGEVDQSGSGRVGFVIGEEDSIAAAFASLLDDMAKGKLKAATATEFAATDMILNDTFRAVTTRQDDPDWGTVNTADIRTAQRAWLRYRDASVSFAAAAYPDASRDGLRTRLTAERTALLKQFLPQPK